jgi:hypothetical protein
MQQDYLGNPITAQGDATLRGIDDFIEGYLAYETRAERILAAAEAEPGSCLANVYAGLLWMLLEAPEAARHAAKYLAAAERAAPLATRREQLNAACCGPGWMTIWQGPCGFAMRYRTHFRAISSSSKRISILNSIAATRRKCCVWR